jgi:hypothetical protein
LVSANNSDPLETGVGAGRREFEVALTPMHLCKRGKGLIAIPDIELPTLTAERVEGRSAGRFGQDERRNHVDLIEHF